MYQRLLKDIKKSLYKVPGRSTLSFDLLEAVVIDIEKNVNNSPLTYLYVEGEQEEEQVLTLIQFCGDKMCTLLMTSLTQTMMKCLSPVITNLCLFSCLYK